MKARTEIEVSLDGRGRSIVTLSRCEAPLLVRVAALEIADAGDALALVLVGGAAGPLGGDDLQLCLHIGAGTRVAVRSVGATLVQPGASGERSTSDVHVSVAAGASLDWRPEPTVSVRGSHHRMTATIELAGDASLRWVDEVSLGRFGEPPGRLAMRQRVEIDGRVAIDHETEFGAAALAGPGAHGRGRCVLSGVLVGDDVPTAAASQVRPGISRGVFPVGPRVALTTCVAASRHDPDFGLTV